MASAVARTDPLLVAAAVAGDQAAWAEIVKGTYPDIYRLCYRLVRNQADAEDLTQETFVQATVALARFRGDAAIETWLYSIATNTVKSHWRKKRPMLLEHLPEQVSSDDPESAAILRDETASVLGAVDRLPEDFRMIVLLRDVEGLTNAEAAATLGVTPLVAKVRLFRAREMLASGLRPDQEVTRRGRKS